MDQETKTSKLYVSDTDYDTELDLVQWSVKDMDTEKCFVIAWAGKDLGFAIPSINKKLKPEEIKFFCEVIKGKTVNLELHTTMNIMDPSLFKKVGLDGVRKAHDVIDQYPFNEVLKKIEKDHR